MRISHNPAIQAALAAAFLMSAAGHAFAWGHKGHVFIGEAAIRNMVPGTPVFAQDAQVQFEVGELAAEADLSKDSGDAATPGSDVHDLERDPGHFIDLDDSGYDIPGPGYPQIEALKIQNLLAPGQGRRDFDTLLRMNTPSGFASQPTQYVGYLPYNIVDQWEQIRKDFAYFRAFTAAIANPAAAEADRAFFQKALDIRRRLLIRDVGYWAHFVGDGSQPMHVSIHFNGWGSYPNPQAYTTSPIHSPFEGAFVKTNVKQDDVIAAMTPYKSCEEVTGLSKCPGIEPRVRAYLLQTQGNVIPLYDLTKALGNGNPWTTKTPTPEQKAFVVARLAAGANELRDEIVDAWHSSDTINVGFPLIKVADIESGKVVWTAAAFAGD